MVTSWVDELRELGSGLDDVARVDLLRALEELKAAAAATQAKVSVDFDASQRSAAAAAGVPADQRGRGVAAQVALARRDSPARGGRHLGMARALVHEMPCTFAALASGRISEWRATLLVRETACLRVEDRRRADRALAGDPRQLEGLGDRRLVARARSVTYRLDPHSAVRRASRAVTDRRVTVRPAPDTMAYLTALLPVAQAAAVYGSLRREADATVGGDGRARGQIMADVLVQRLTGQAQADAVPVALDLVMTDATLLGSAEEPGMLADGTVVPSGLARGLVAAATQPGCRTWVRRLFAHPETGALVGMESRARLFPKGLRRFLQLRDQRCRTPWCDAPIRHLDHIRAVVDGGATEARNGQGLCEACNYAKQAAGWRAWVDPTAAGHEVETITPTGHRYRSYEPPLGQRSIDLMSA